jgi:7-cyano-7-deazaguanine synthase
LNIKRPVPYESVRFAVGRVVLAKILDPVLADRVGFRYRIANPAEPDVGPHVKSVDTDIALVLFSGGQDSTVCLAWALQRFAAVETVGFDYGQRHAIELEVRPRIRERMSTLDPHWRKRLKDDHLVRIDALAAISETALTREVAIEIADTGLPTTFVPGRNLLFLSFAGALAYRRGAKHLVAGMCETDFSGYPDCRDDTIKAMQVALGLGMDRRFVIHTPLMWIDKAATFALAQKIAGDAFVDLLVEETHTCYLGDRSHRHAWGYGCAHCPACQLRAEGFRKWKEQG